MSDQQLREFERRFRETGAVGDEAAWLRARVRVGELDARRLELLAVIDYPAAIYAVDSQFADWRCVPMWQRNLARFGREVSAQTILCAAECWRHDTRTNNPWFKGWLNTTLPLAHAFLAQPGPESEAALGRALEHFLIANGGQSWQDFRTSDVAPFVRLAAAIYSILHGDVTGWVDQAIRDSVDSCIGGVEDALREDLARWVLTGG